MAAPRTVTVFAGAVTSGKLNSAMELGPPVGSPAATRSSELLEITDPGSVEEQHQKQGLGRRRVGGLQPAVV